MLRRKFVSSKFHVSSELILWFSTIMINWSKWRFIISEFSAFLRTVARDLRLIFWNSKWRYIQRVIHAWLMKKDENDSLASCISSFVAADLMIFKREFRSKLINLRIYSFNAKFWSDFNLLSCIPRTTDAKDFSSSRKRSRCDETSKSRATFARFASEFSFTYSIACWMRFSISE